MQQAQERVHPGYVHFKCKYGLFLPHLCRGHRRCTGNCTRGSKEGRVQDCSGRRGIACQWVRSSASRRAGRSPAGSHARRRVGSWRGRRPPAPPSPLTSAALLPSPPNTLSSRPDLPPSHHVSSPSLPRGRRAHGQPERREGWRCDSRRSPRRLHRGPGPRPGARPGGECARADGAGAARPSPRAPGRWAAGGRGADAAAATTAAAALLRARRGRQAAPAPAAGRCAGAGSGPGGEAGRAGRGQASGGSAPARGRGEREMGQDGWRNPSGAPGRGSGGGCAVRVGGGGGDP